MVWDKGNSVGEGKRMLDGDFRVGVRTGVQTFRRGKIVCRMYSFQA